MKRLATTTWWRCSFGPPRASVRSASCAAASPADCRLRDLETVALRDAYRRPLKPSALLPDRDVPPIYPAHSQANRPAPCGPATLQSPFGSGHF
jgi:hypothetical protein